MLARIPEAGPWTAFVTVHPSVAHEVEEGELRDYFHDGEKIKVEKVRIVLHRDTGNVKMAFVDFDDAASLRNALYLQVLSLARHFWCLLQHRRNVAPSHPCFPLNACAADALSRSSAQG